MQSNGQAREQTKFQELRRSISEREKNKASATSPNDSQRERPASNASEAASKQLTSSVQEKNFLPSDAKLTSELINRGDASALAAAESFMWGALNRQTDVVAKLLTWKFVSFTTPTDGAVAWIFASVPEPWRGTAATPERLLAFMHENEFEPYGAFHVFGHEAVGSTHEQIKIRLFAADGRTRDLFLLMKRTDAGWRLEQSPVLLERLAKRLREQVPPK